MKTSVITARLDEATLARLDDLSSRTERSRAWLVARAIKHYLDDEAAFAAFIKVGEDDIDRGDCLTQEEMEAWVTDRYRTAAAA